MRWASPPSVHSVARGATVVLVVVAVGFLGASYLRANDVGVAPGDRIAPPSDGITVVATAGAEPTGPVGDALSDGTGRLVAYAPSGELLYENGTYHSYWNVDPAGGTAVTYLASERLGRAACGVPGGCHRYVVETVDLATGELHRLYSMVEPADGPGTWRDVDRIDADRLLVADARLERVFVLNTTSGLIEWEWYAQTTYTLSDHGTYPENGLQLTDAERLEDGRVVVSLQHVDQLLVVDPERGIVDRVGGLRRHEVLFHPSSADYLPAARGGPAVLVADADNRRVVEYERTAAGWTRTWSWREPRLRTPRDADRLPGGNTLVADSTADLVVEADPSGEVVWSVRLRRPYDAERLGTGDESATGWSARSLGLEPRPGTPAPGGVPGLSRAVVARVPRPVVVAVDAVRPGWMHVPELFAGGLLVAGLVGWAALGRQARSTALVRPFRLPGHRRGR